MFQTLALNAFLKLVCVALCKFLDICICEDDCPDGVCDDAYKALEDLDGSTPEPVAAPSKVASFDFNPDWSKLREVVDAIVALVNAIKAFLGLNKVG